jgi:hypothetical protein
MFVLYLLNTIFLLRKTGDMLSIFLAAFVFFSNETLDKVDRELEELFILFQRMTRKSGAE